MTLFIHDCLIAHCMFDTCQSFSVCFAVGEAVLLMGSCEGRSGTRLKCVTDGEVS